MQAWINKCKGVTVYRDGCRSFQVLNAGIKDSSSSESMLDQLTQSIVTDRLAGLNKLPFDAKPAVRYKIKLPNNINAYIGVTEDENGNPTELFINVGKSGTDMQADAQAIARSCSAWFQEGLPIEKLYKQYIGIHSGNVMFDSGEKILSLPDAVAHILGLYIDDEGYKTEITSKLNGLHIPCPECKNEMAVQEGCMTCTNPRCGYAAC
jgi:ribonucleoside-diphosphate reductase alpha chain